MKDNNFWIQRHIIETALLRFNNINVASMTHFNYEVVVVDHFGQCYIWSKVNLIGDPGIWGASFGCNRDKC